MGRGRPSLGHAHRSNNPSNGCLGMGPSEPPIAATGADGITRTAQLCGAPAAPQEGDDSCGDTWSSKRASGASSHLPTIRWSKVARVGSAWGDDFIDPDPDLGFAAKGADRDRQCDGSGTAQGPGRSMPVPNENQAERDYDE